jgi:hypothetical protein
MNILCTVRNYILVSIDEYFMNILCSYILVSIEEYFMNIIDSVAIL